MLLREYWLDLKNAAFVRDNASLLRTEYAGILQTMVASRQLDAAVAEEIGIAFDQAVEHISQRAACYEPLPPEFAPRQDMSAQAVALTEMAQRSSVEPATVERARAALERDVAWLSRFQAGQTPDSLQAVEATPAETEAARILVEILMNRNPLKQ
jgi:antitoxin component of RelBE/YafQ-DinJ toxin-antitoxin module